MSVQNETCTTFSRNRTTSGRRNENMTVSNAAVNHSITKKGNRTICDEQVFASPQTKITKDIQTSMELVNFNGKSIQVQVLTFQNYPYS